MSTPRPSTDAFASLVEIVAQLRGPQGCPWDKEQTHESLTRYAIEETFELVEVLESKSDSQKDQKLKEELGDVLFQVLLHAQIASERGAFSINDVIQTLSEKMIRRHPHVFAGEKVNTAEEVSKNWEKIKAQEKSSRQLHSPLDVPPMPALLRAFKIGKKTESLRFDWEDSTGALLKVEEEFAELKEALDEDQDSAIRHEMGDTLFSLAQLSRHLQMDPEQILRVANRRFEERFNLMVDLIEQEGLAWESLGMDEKDRYWVRAKLQLRKKKS